MNPVDVHSASILIVDCQEQHVERLKEILTKDGYTKIKSVSEPEEVAKLHRKKCFDLILLDLDFPGIDGFKAMHTLKNTIADPCLSVVVLTAHASHKLRALKAGAKDFISTPFAGIELTTRIKNILEVRLLYHELQKYVKELEVRVQERTAELQTSEARYRGFTDLASDWYWEQDTEGNFTKVSGPVPEILGIEIDSQVESTNSILGTGWNADEQSILRSKVSARESFLDFEFSRKRQDGESQTFLVSGQPMFDSTCNFLGYRGVGVEISAAKKKH